MSVKIALLKSGETLISDVKELVTGDVEEDQKKVYGYLLINPKRVNMEAPVFLAEQSNVEESSVQVSLSSWSLITKDTEFANLLQGYKYQFLNYIGPNKVSTIFPITTDFVNKIMDDKTKIIWIHGIKNWYNFNC